MKGLLVIDIQNDFLPGGSLAVPLGDQTIPVANKLAKLFSFVAASKDWHPNGHVSFASTHPKQEIGDLIDTEHGKQILWPDHCVQGTSGAEFPSSLKLPENTHIIEKGIHKDIDSYSAFFDNAKANRTTLHEILQKNHIKTLYIVGLATDYCVKFSVLDALALGYEVFVVEDGCRGVEVQDGDIKKALAEMKDQGAKIISSDQAITNLS